MESGNVKSIILNNEDGTEKEILKGFVLEFSGDDMHIDMVNFDRLDLLRAGVGLLSTIAQMGMDDEFQKMLKYYSGSSEAD